MPARLTTPQSEINAAFEQATQRFTRQLVRTLSYVGEQAVNEARMHHTYRDQTGNLTSSMGYVVVVDGKEATRAVFDQAYNGAQGAANGKKFLKELVGRFPTGVALIVVAGMNYASYVADRGYNVIDSGASLAMRLVPQLLKQLKK